MDAIDPDLEMLGALVAADEAAGEPKTFTLTYTGGFDTRVLIGHSGWPQEQQAPSDVQVDELDARGWVRVAGYQGKGRIFAVTSTGRQAWRESVAERDRPRRACRTRLASGPRSARADLRQVPR